MYGTRPGYRIALVQAQEISPAGTRSRPAREQGSAAVRHAWRSPCHALWGLYHGRDPEKPVKNLHGSSQANTDKAAAGMGLKPAAGLRNSNSGAVYSRYINVNKAEVKR